MQLIKKVKGSLYLEQVFLSDCELYFSSDLTDSVNIIIQGEDAVHISKVMRHKIGDIIFVTNGKGIITKASIKEVNKELIICQKIDVYNYKNELSNVYFCLPKLKSPDRFEFALEKCVEAGITNFVVYNANRAVSKGSKIERWNKIALAALKQTLRSYKPEIVEIKDIKDIVKDKNNVIVILDQNSNSHITGIDIDKSKKYFFVFGPEGGLSDEEIKLADENHKFFLTENRLRSETAIITCAMFLNYKIKNE